MPARLFPFGALGWLVSGDSQIPVGSSSELVLLTVGRVRGPPPAAGLQGDQVREWTQLPELLFSHLFL